MQREIVRRIMADVEQLDRTQLIERITQLAQRLAQAEDDKKAFIESSYDGYWDWHPQEGYEYMSPRFWEMFGIDPATKKHDPQEWQHMIFAEDLQMALQNFQRHCETQGQHPYRQEVRYRHADGSTVTVLCRGQVVEWDEKGQARRMIGTHTDITAIRQAQQMLAMESEYKSDFLANVSHELRSPLNSMLLLLDVLLEDRYQNLKAQQLENLTVMRNAGKDLKFLINDLLDQRKIAKGKLSIAPKAIDIQNWANALSQQFKSQFAQKNIAFTLVNHCPQPHVLHSDPQRLNQILRNLIYNAFKFTPEGGRVSVQIEPTDDPVMNLRIQVQDSGPGMSADEIRRLFRPFEQGRAGKQQRYQGTGLGLAIAKSLAQMLSALLEVRSQPGCGAVFTLTLADIAQVDAEDDTQSAVVVASAVGRSDADDAVAWHNLSADQQRVQRAFAVLSGRTVLIVDDDVLTLFALRQLLQSVDTNMLYAQDGEQALRTCQQNQVDLIVMDIMMPNIDGFSACCQIRQLPQGQSIPIIGMSGHIRQQDKQIQQAGMTGFIPKPIEPLALAELINRVLR